MALLSFLNKKTRSKSNKYIKAHHFLFVEALFQEAADEALKWSWSSWWPKDNPLQYLTDDGVLEQGKQCRLILKGKFFNAVFKGEIIQFRPGRALQFVWRSGMMVGQEFIIAEERSNGMRIDHRARYAGSNIIAKLIWILFFQKKYEESIKMALEALKKSILQTQQDVN